MDIDAPKITLEDLTPVRKRMQVEIPADVVTAELDSAFQDIGRRSRLRGFRPGKAPRAVLERMFGDQIRREVVAHLVEASFVRAVESNHLAVVGTPDIQADELVPGEGLRYAATVDVRPAIAVKGLDALTATRPTAAVTDQEVERVLAALRESAAVLKPIEGRATVEAGDVVTVDLATRLDDADPVRREGVQLEAGAGAFPLALERQLVGQHKGAHLSLKVPYPADYANANLAGKTAEFEVEITDLRLKELPPLDDDFARDHGRCESLAELRTKIRADLEQKARHRAEAAVREALLGQLLTENEFEVPASLVERRCEYMLATLDVRLPDGAEGEAIAERVRAELRPRAEREVRAELLLDAIAEREGIDVTDDAVNAEIDGLAAHEQQAPERLRAFYERPEARQALRQRMRRERALQVAVDRAKIVPEVGAEEVARA